MLPTTREEFKAFCLRQLGQPVIQVNVADQQAEDNIDLALAWYRDYHMDASEKVFYKYMIDDTDRTNRYITLPENIFGVVKVFNVGTLISGSDGLFDIQYQIALNDLYTLTSVALAPYYQMRMNLSLIEEILVGQIPIRYNKNANRLYLDMDWDKIPVDNYILLEAYEVLDPDLFPDIWADRWLIRYATALIKKQWGDNLKKFQGQALPGGITTNGQQIYDEAVQEIATIEADVLNSYGLPPEMLLG